jgi:hypothetical protein
LGYGLNVLNQAIQYAHQQGFSGVVVNENVNTTDLIRQILDEFLLHGYVKKESEHYVFDSIIQK